MNLETRIQAELTRFREEDKFSIVAYELLAEVLEIHSDEAIPEMFEGVNASLDRLCSSIHGRRQGE